MTPEAKEAARQRMLAYHAQRKALAGKALVEQAQTVLTSNANASMAKALLPVPVLQATVVAVECVQQASPKPITRTSSREYRIIANSDGQMVCENGPCLCGKGKREWHPICCR